MIFLIHGKARSGKDTVANSITSKVEVTKVWYAKALKDFVIKYFKYSKEEVYGVKTEGSRRALQGLGQFAREQLYECYWSDKVIKEIKRLHAEGVEHFVISDCRHWNEILEILAAFDGGQYTKVVKKLPKDEWVNYQERNYGRTSEDAVSDYLFDPSFPEIPCVTMTIHRNEKPDIEFGETHESEVGLDDFPFEFIIENNSDLESLDRKVECFLNQVMEGK